MNNSNIILIPIPAYFSFQECIWFLSRNYDDCLHIVDAHGIRKALEVNGQTILFGVKERINFLEVEILVGESNPETAAFLIEYIREWFDMERDIQPFYALLAQDNNLEYMQEAYKGLRLIGISNLFEAICWSIIGQQINLTFAYKVKRRLVEKYGSSVEYENEVYYVFPSCQTLAEVAVQDLRAMQFSDKKAEYVIGIAKAFCDGKLSKEILYALPDFVSRQKYLTAYRGIGVWTANYALMKTLRESGGIPHGDVGLLNALASHEIISSRSETEKIDQFFKRYAGWETYAVFYLWRSLSVR